MFSIFVKDIFTRIVSIFVAVPKCFDPVVLHAQGGAGVLAVSIEVGQTRASHQVAQVAVVCCEVIISWTCGMRMAKDITRAVFPFGEPEEEIVFIPDYWGDVGSLQENRLEGRTSLRAQRVSLIATSRARLFLIPQINLCDDLGGDLVVRDWDGVGH